MPEYLIKVELNIKMKVPIGTSENDIQDIMNECEYNFHYGDDRVIASREEMVDVDII